MGNATYYCSWFITTQTCKTDNKSDQITVQKDQSNQQSISDFISDVSNKQADLNSFFERFKEPVLIPSNIENGLGYFGGYYSKTIKVSK